MGSMDTRFYDEESIEETVAALGESDEAISTHLTSKNKCSVAKTVSAAVRLKSARERSGQTIEDIAKVCCISQRYLCAIDAADYDKLPELTFSVGFIRAYADVVGENPDEIAALFKSEICCSAKQEADISPIAAEIEKPERRTPAWLAPVSGLFGAIATFLWIGSGVLFPGGDSVHQDDTAALEAVQSDLKSQGQRYIAAIDSILPAVYAAAPEREKGVDIEVIFRAREDSWLRIADQNGHELWSGVLEAGTEYRPLVSEGMTLSVSNAGAFDLTVDGEDLPDLGARGQVILDAPIMVPAVIDTTL